jgi:Flp pilus assembly pilin Flp
MRKLCGTNKMPIFRDASAALTRLFARSDREHGQSLTEYGLLLAAVAVATIAVLGMVSSTVSSQLGSVTTALGGEGGTAAFVAPVPLPPWVVIGAPVVAAAGLYLLKMRRG